MLLINQQEKKRKIVETFQEQVQNKRPNNMSKPHSKTPIMLLQEIAIKKNPRAPPQYLEILDRIPAEYAGQNMRFYIECMALGYTSIGGGVTKKIAKHTAAEKLLHKFQRASQRGDEESDDMPNYNQSLESNAISELHDYCTVRNFHKPVFGCLAIFGPTHDPSFTFECRLDSVVGKHTAGNKQLAKQMSAKAVLDVLKQGHPDSEKKLAPVGQPTNVQTPGEIGREKITSYRELKKRNMVEGMGTTIKDRHNFFRRQDEDFVTALKSILDSTAHLSEDEKCTELLKELQSMWPSQIVDFADTKLKQFELVVDCETFTCVIVADENHLRGEIVQYFKEMLKSYEDTPAGFDLDSMDFALEPLLGINTNV